MRNACKWLLTVGMAAAGAVPVRAQASLSDAATELAAARWIKGELAAQVIQKPLVLGTAASWNPEDRHESARLAAYARALGATIDSRGDTRRCATDANGISQCYLTRDVYFVTISVATVKGDTGTVSVKVEQSAGPASRVRINAFGYTLRIVQEGGQLRVEPGAKAVT